MIQNRTIVLIAILLVIGLGSSFSVSQRAVSSVTSISKTVLSPLAAYGALIFNNQSCESCHTLSVENEELGIISLDGVGGKFSDAWLYDYLREPGFVFINSVKPSYKELENNSLHIETLEIAGSNYSWDVLQKELIQAEMRLDSLGIEAKGNELMALIAYIQQIPATRKQEILDSVEYQRLMEVEEAWRMMLADSSSILMTTANDTANKVKGEQLYRSKCAACHGFSGEGRAAPNLADEYWLYGSQKTDIARSIIFGNPQRGMLAWYTHLTPVEVGELVVYIASLKGSNPPNGKAPQGIKD